MLVIGAALQNARIIDIITARFGWVGVIGLVSDIIVASAAGIAAIVAVPLLMTVAPLLSNIVNSAAVAMVMAPLALQSNLLVTGCGGYEFRDCWRLGLPVSLGGRLSLVVSLL